MYSNEHSNMLSSSEIGMLVLFRIFANCLSVVSGGISYIQGKTTCLNCCL